MNERITILIPVYQVEKYLPRCIDSILAQSYQDFELLLVDDGSTDASPRICDEYAARDERIHVIHQANQGVAVARNAALDWAFEHGTGDWICWIDSDDYVHPRYLELLYRACADFGVSLSGCTCVEVEQLEPVAFIDVVQENRSEMSVEDAFCQGLVNDGPCEKLAKKELYRGVRYPVGWKFAEDSATTYKVVFACERMVYIPYQLYYYQVNLESITHSGWNPARVTRLISGDEQLAFFKGKHPKAYQVGLKNFLDIITLLLYWRRRDMPEDKENFKKLKKYLRKYSRIYAKECGQDRWVWYWRNVSLEDCNLYEKVRIYWCLIKHKLRISHR